jgi:hypothetical protein
MGTNGQIGISRFVHFVHQVHRRMVCSQPEMKKSQPNPTSIESQDSGIQTGLVLKAILNHGVFGVRSCRTSRPPGGDLALRYKQMSFNYSSGKGYPTGGLEESKMDI